MLNCNPETADNSVRDKLRNPANVMTERREMVTVSAGVAETVISSARILPVS